MRRPDNRNRGCGPGEQRCQNWSPKLQGNKERDARHAANLRALGWDILTIWECEIGEPNLARRIREFLERRRP